MIEEALRWFLECYRDSNYCTSGTFVLPVWADRAWWKLLKGASVIAYYGEGHPLFTSPDWRRLSRGEGGYAYGEGMRCFRGNTRWPVVVIHFPALLRFREGEIGGGKDVGGSADVGEAARGDGRDMRVGAVRRYPLSLEGKGSLDLLGLSGLQTRPVQPMRGVPTGGLAVKQAAALVR
jgi:hypothetical protein